MTGALLREALPFSSFSVDDVPAAKAFYADTLGLDVSEEIGMGLLQLRLAGGHEVIVYPKPDHRPAVYTVLDFRGADVEAAVAELAARGVRFERYDGFMQDERGISRDGGGPPIAWFTDPAGNIFSVLEEQ